MNQVSISDAAQNSDLFTNPMFSYAAQARNLHFDMVFISLMMILVVIVLGVIIVRYRSQPPILLKEKIIEEFSVPLEFDPYPGPKTVSNLEDCNADSLKVCKLNDVTTNFGCKELLVQCKHFDKDTPYFDTNGRKSIIPKNNDPNEGYALALTIVADSCNPYHGDMTLVTTSKQSSEYMLVCSCKNSGYIGNESLLGNCTTPYICNGQIDSINKPLNQIECLCKATEVSERYDTGVPVCKTMNVNQANAKYEDWSYLVPWNSDRQLPIDKFNPTISDNLHTTRLLDPCRNSLHNTEYEIPGGRFNDLHGECDFTDYGLPVSNGMLRFNPRPTTNAKEPKRSCDGGLLTGQYSFIRMTDDINNVRKIYGIGVDDGVPFVKDLDKRKIVLQPPDGLSLGQSNALNITAHPRTFQAPLCKKFWPDLRCDFENNYSHDFLGLPLAGSDDSPAPNLFYSNGFQYVHNDQLISKGLVLTTRGVTFNYSRIRNSNVRFYGLQWAHKLNPEKNGVLVFKEADDSLVHKNNITQN